VVVRPVTAADADRLLAWANEPVTRAASFRPGRIAPDEHARWLAERLASPVSRLLIGSIGTAPIGLVRFERGADGVAEIGITVDRDARGRGLGGALLAAGLASVRAEPAFGVTSFVARVRVGNDASIRMFERAGFRGRGVTSCHGVPCLVLDLPA
jgi:RimJ/RimL family protein N-acetyltransferase